MTLENNIILQKQLLLFLSVKNVYTPSFVEYIIENGIMVYEDIHHHTIDDFTITEGEPSFSFIWKYNEKNNRIPYDEHNRKIPYYKLREGDNIYNFISSFSFIDDANI